MTTRSYLDNGDEVEIEFYYRKGHFSRRSLPDEPDDDPEIEMISVVTLKDNVEMINKISNREYDELLNACWKKWKGEQ